MNHTINVLSQLIQALPVGTNLALLHFLWMLVSGALLPSRGALFPALKSTGLSDAATRRAWVAFRKGVWQMPAILVLWREQIQSQPDWHPHRYEGDRPVPVDVTAFWRPALKNCPSKHYHPAAQRALPAVIMAKQIGFVTIPVRTTLSRRYKQLYPTLQAFIAFLGEWAENLNQDFDSQVLIEDASLFKAQGPVWHQADRAVNRIPEKLRHLDREARWGKSAYHGWVYGYSLHLTCNRAGFPKLAQVETANVDESVVFDQKKERLFAFHPEAIVGDNAYFKAMRVRQWATQGVLLLSPAARWKNGKYATAYHRFIRQKPVDNWLKGRKTAIEPVFDLFSKVLGTVHNHKQLPIQSLKKVQTFLCLGVLAIQIAMIINNVFSLPFRHIATILSALN